MFSVRYGSFNNTPAKNGDIEPDYATSEALGRQTLVAIITRDEERKHGH